MNLKEFKRVAELCELLEIKTFSDLKIFEESHEMTFVNSQELINALEKELNK